MKSLGFSCDASSVVEVLDASFLADGEFCANEVVTRNAINIRVITRNRFWFTGFLPYGETRVWAQVLPAILQTRNVQHARFQSSGIAYRSPGKGLQSSSQPVTGGEPDCREDLTGSAEPNSPWCQVSGVNDIPRYGNAAKHRLVQKKNNLSRLRAQTCARIVGVRRPEWNCSCSNGVMRTLALRDSLTLKEET